MVGKLDREVCRVELINCGDGLRGDYNPDDPGDVALFRLSISRYNGMVWEAVGNTCTQLPVNSDFETQEKALRLIMSQVHSPVKRGQDITEILQDLSWISPDWLEEDASIA